VIPVELVLEIVVRLHPLEERKYLLKRPFRIPLRRPSVKIAGEPAGEDRAVHGARAADYPTPWQGLLHAVGQRRIEFPIELVARNHCLQQSGVSQVIGKLCLS
jgi:hypothetical protein